MKKVRKLKKRTAYVLGLVFALVFSYAFREKSSDQDQVITSKIFSKVPQAQADIPSSPPPAGDGDGGDAAGDAAGDGGGSDGCFVAGTQVCLADGTGIAIESILPGMVVRGLGESTFVVAGLIAHDGHDAFLHNFANEPLKIFTLSNGDTLKTVDGHPVLVDNGAGWQWSNMSDLRIGTKISHISSDLVTVAKVEVKTDQFPTLFNLELIVEPGVERSFYANGVLVRDTQFIAYSISRWLAPPVATTYHQTV